MTITFLDHNFSAPFDQFAAISEMSKDSMELRPFKLNSNFNTDFSNIKYLIASDLLKNFTSLAKLKINLILHSSLDSSHICELSTYKIYVVSWRFFSYLYLYQERLLDYFQSKPSQF